MFQVEGERLDGTVSRVEFPTIAEAEYASEILHQRHSGGGVWATFRVLDESGDVYSEMECD